MVYAKATAMTLAAIVFSQIGAVFNCRTEKQSVFRAGMFRNRQVNLGILAEIIIIVIVVYTPGIQTIFHTAALSLQDWLFLCIWPPIILAAEETRKAILRGKEKNRGKGGK